MYRESFRAILILMLSLLVLFALSGCEDNRAPIADAGSKFKIEVGKTASLDASDSYDKDGDKLQYQWAFSIVPEGSSSIIESSDSAFASFVPDVSGIFVLDLIVFDGEAYSARDHIFITVNLSSAVTDAPVSELPNDDVTDNLPDSPPVDVPPIVPPHLNPPPNAPTLPPMPISMPEIPSYVALLSEKIIIEPTIETDAHLAVEWELLHKPLNSIVELFVFDQGDNYSVEFSGDLPGLYTLRQIGLIEDHRINSDTISIHVVENRVTAGFDQMVGVGSAVQLNYGYYAPIPPVDASAKWVIVEKPVLSTAEVESIDQHTAQFIPDVAGDYEVLVTVVLPDGTSSEDSVVYTAFNDFIGEVDHATLTLDCIGCHNGLVAGGKSVSHINSSDSCESCHTIAAWFPLVFVDHADVVGACMDCHNNDVAMGKPAIHITSSDTCESCHSISVWVPEVFVNHSDVIGDCKDCHNGIVAIGKPVDHIANSDSCDACHSTTKFIPVITVDHTQLIGTCNSCHDGVIATGKSSIHIQSSEACEECHNTNNWITVIPPELVKSIPGLDISLIADATVYQVGELIKAKAIFTNNSDAAIDLIRLYSNANPLIIEVNGANFSSLTLNNPNDPDVDTPAIGITVLKVGESITREVIWDQMKVKGGLVPAGTYTLEAYVLMPTSVANQNMRIGVKFDLMIDPVVDLLTAENALLLAIEEPMVKVWYEDGGKDITCRLDSQVVLLDTYKIIPIETLVPVLDSEIDCHTELTRTTAYEWNIYFHSTNKDLPFSYYVVIDAVSGELRMGLPN